jgi:hypothetical protein
MRGGWKRTGGDKRPMPYHASERSGYDQKSPRPCAGISAGRHTNESEFSGMHRLVKWIEPSRAKISVGDECVPDHRVCSRATTVALFFVSIGIGLVETEDISAS